MKLDAYIRVSKVQGREGDSFISPVVQRERIEAWAKASGHELDKVWEELNESGARTERPKLDQLMQRIESGETGGVVVMKLDRFGRSFVGSLTLVERIREAGAVLVSVNDGLDTSTSTGRLVLRILLAIAEDELERIRGNWDEARRRAIDRGIHISAITPFGYARESDDLSDGAHQGKLIPDPVTGPLVTEMFRMRAAGASWPELRKLLTDAGAKTARGREDWGLRALRDIIRSDVYLGVARNGGFVNEEAHAPLTDQQTWRQAQRRGVVTSPRSDEPAALHGLLRCAGCRYAMNSGFYTLASGEHVRHYRCRSQNDKSNPCSEPAAIGTNMGITEHIVGAFLEQVDALRLSAHTDVAEVAELEREVTAARATLDEFAADARVQAALGIDAYVAGLEARQAILNAAESQLSTARERLDSTTLPADTGDLRTRWDGLPAKEQRRLLSAAIACVFIRRRISDNEPLPDRVFICWRGEAPDLPGQGKRNFVSRPFRFEDPMDAGILLAEDRLPDNGDSGT